MKKRIAFVVQRYGLEVNGGAELLARQMVEHMTDKYDVEVLTTKAVDYITWRNEYKNDVEEINGVTVRRFATEIPRDIDDFASYSPTVVANPSHTMADEEEWIDRQGPLCPKLINFVRDNADNYDVFIFMTYLYYTTVRVLPLVAEKSILIPTAHNEGPIFLKLFRNIFSIPKAIYYLTDEEKQFVEKEFNNANIINNDGKGGCGIELPDNINPSKVAKNYMVYAGRIDEGKGCARLFEFWEKFREYNYTDLKLVMFGKACIPIPERDDIIYLGFVSEQEKYNIIAGSKFMIMPSPFESLSIVVLEAMALAKPILVNEECEVLKGHCIKSNAGLFYSNYYEFERCIKYLDTHKNEVELMGKNGVDYVANNYTWDIIIGGLVDLIEQIK